MVASNGPALGQMGPVEETQGSSRLGAYRQHQILLRGWRSFTQAGASGAGKDPRTLEELVQGTEFPISPQSRA